MLSAPTRTLNFLKNSGEYLSKSWPDLSSIPKLGMQIGDVNLDGVEDVVAAEVCGYDV